MRFITTVIVGLGAGVLLATANPSFQIFVTDPDSSTVWIAGRPATVKWILSFPSTNVALAGSLPVELISGKSPNDMHLVAILGSAALNTNSLIVQIPDNLNLGSGYHYSVRIGEDSYSELFFVKRPLIVGDTSATTTAILTDMSPTTEITTAARPLTIKILRPATKIIKASTSASTLPVMSISKKQSWIFGTLTATNNASPTTAVHISPLTTPVVSIAVDSNIKLGPISTGTNLDRPTLNHIPQGSKKNAGHRRLPRTSLEQSTIISSILTLMSYFTG